MLNLEKINDSITLDVLSYSRLVLLLSLEGLFQIQKLKFLSQQNLWEIQNQMKTGYGNLL